MNLQKRNQFVNNSSRMASRHAHRLGNYELRLRTALALVLAILLPACGTANWKEEVELHDGRKIIVDRYQSYGGGHEIGQKPPIRTQEIEFAVPGTRKTYKFKSEYSEDVGRANLLMLALHIKDDIPYLITEPHLCLAYNKWGRPNPPYVVFKHDGGEWRRVPLDELPVDFKTLNLAISTKNKEMQFRENGVLSAEAIKKLNRELRQPEYLELLRERITKTGWAGSAVNCEVMVHYQCGWISPHGVFGQKFMDNSCK